MQLVLDASVSIAWALRESSLERAAYAEALAHAAGSPGCEFHVPAQWELEMGHVLLRELRAKRLGLQTVHATLDRLEALDIKVHHVPSTARGIFELGGRYHLQGYDVPYFDLARSLGLPLATLDGGQRTAAKSFGVKLWQPAAGI